MTNSITRAVPARPARTARTVPTATEGAATTEEVTRAALAVLAVESFTATIKSASLAGLTVYTSTYGADVKPAAVKLALRAAREASGEESKSKGGARADVIAVLATVDTAPVFGTDAAPRVYLAAATARLAELAAAKRARTARKSALADTVNSAAASAEQRHAALDVLTGMDDADKGAKRAALIARLAAVVESAREGGLSQEDCMAIIETAYSE